MRNDMRTYSSISKNAPKVEGKFDVAFGEFPRLSGFTMKFKDEHTCNYEFHTTGHMVRGRRNGSTDLRTDTSVAKEAVKLIKDPEFMKQTMEQFQAKKYSITQKDVKNFADEIKKHYNISDSDSLTAKLMS
jgi:6-phosphofructokinase